MLGAQRQAGGVWLPHGMGSGVALGNPRFHFPLAILQKAPSENSPHCPGDSALGSELPAPRVLPGRPVCLLGAG